MVHPSASAGALLHAVRTGRARSRAELVALTGASRNTVSARVDQLISADLLEEGGRGGSTGGRPPTLLRSNSRAGCVLALGLGVTSGDVAVTGLSAEMLATEGHPIDIADGPGPVLAEVDRPAQLVLAEAGLTPGDDRIGLVAELGADGGAGRDAHPVVVAEDGRAGGERAVELAVDVDHRDATVHCLQGDRGQRRAPEIGSAFES